MQHDLPYSKLCTESEMRIAEHLPAASYQKRNGHDVLAAAFLHQAHKVHLNFFDNGSFIT